MCEFWSAVVTRTGKVYHLGDIISHERIIEKFKLKDKNDNLCRVEIPVLNVDFSIKPKKEWKLKIDEEEKPSWWSVKKEERCFKELDRWLKASGFRRRLKAVLNDKYLNSLKKKSGELIIHREKLLASHEKLFVEFYLLGEKQPWDSVRASMQDSLRDSVWYSVWDYVWDSVRYSVQDSVWTSLWNPVRDSMWYSVWDSMRDSLWDSVRVLIFPKKKYPLALPKKIFDLGYIHCLVKGKDGISRIHVYGKKGKLLKKIDFKNKDGNLLIKNQENLSLEEVIRGNGSKKAN